MTISSFEQFERLLELPLLVLSLTAVPIVCLLQMCGKW